MDFARRAYDHSFRIDPIVRSLLDTDFYKFLMMQFIWEHFPHVRTKWAVHNRTKSVKLAEIIDIDELRAQLDYVRTLRFTDRGETELVFLQGQTFYGQEGIFKPSFINTLRAFKLPEYELSKGDDGQFVLTFEGPWWQVMLWEIYALTILNELRSRAVLGQYNKSELDIIYARAKVKLYEKLEILSELPDLNLTDFGTRRRHGFLWQEHCVLTAKEVIGKGFTGTSNVLLAARHGLEAKGTNAHELPMVFAALARAQGGDLREAQYEVLKKWQNQYRGNLLVGLPDTFGSTQFFKGAPQWLSNWKGFRPDSKSPITAGNEIIEFFHRQGLTDDQIKQKLVLFSDGLDVHINGKGNGTDIVSLYDFFNGIIGLGFGWGTNMTNDFIDCAPRNANDLRAISLVCKVVEANGHPTVKLSDNYDKAMGPEEEINIYREAFGTEGVANAPVLV